MSVLQECPICNYKQSLKKKRCRCGGDLVKFKRQGKIRYWINFRLPTGKYRREFVSYSIEDAKAADGKRRVQKKENRQFDMLPESNITFSELTEWYTSLSRLKELAYYEILKINLRTFNSVFGGLSVKELKPTDLEEFQIMRKKAGKSDSYIDQEVGAAQTMVKKAWENDKVSGDALKPFMRVGKLLKSKNSNARKRVVSLKEYKLLTAALPRHARDIFITGFFTGMRMGEILTLTWDRVDLKHRRIELPKSITKDREDRIIPIPEILHSTLSEIPRAIHDDHVFLFRGKPLKSIRASLKKACEEVGIPYGRNTKNGIIPHDLRHTFNTHMRKTGTHDTVTMEITGHSTREMFDRYNTVDEAEKIEAVKRMETILFAEDKNTEKDNQI